MKILAVSDRRLPQLTNVEFLRRQYGGVDVLVSCGDLDADYLDLIASVLFVPMFYVRGNHDTRYTSRSPGGVDLHHRVVDYNGVILVGLEGSIDYNRKGVQYSEATMTASVLRLMPMLLWHRARQGYGADFVVAHSPPRNVNDRSDHAHRGFRAFRWLLRWAVPRYLIHGHIDLNDRRVARETVFAKTRVVNINPVMVLDTDTLFAN